MNTSQPTLSQAVSSVLIEPFGLGGSVFLLEWELLGGRDSLGKL